MGDLLERLETLIEFGEYERSGINWSENYDAMVTLLKNAKEGDVFTAEVFHPPTWEKKKKLKVVKLRTLKPFDTITTSLYVKNVRGNARDHWLRASKGLRVVEYLMGRIRQPIHTLKPA